MDECNLGSYGAIGVAEAIIRNKNLRIVSLRSNMIDDEAARAFGAALPRLTIDLEMLDLSNNCITDAGGEHLAIGVSLNQSLRKLNLKTNDLAQNSGRLFIQALEKNKFL